MAFVFKVIGYFTVEHVGVGILLLEMRERILLFCRGFFVSVDSWLAVFLFGGL
jgi:hypothetical protein